MLSRALNLVRFSKQLAVLVAGLGFAFQALALNNAQFVSQSVPSIMAPGQSYAVSVTMTNTGDTTWTSSGLYRLGAQNPQDNTTWGTARVALPGSVAPGTSVTFNFNVTAPTTVGTYNFQWRMVQDTVEWFGDFTPNVAVKDGVNNAAFVSQSAPAVMIPGQSYPVAVTMQNTGNTTWTAANLYRLGTQNPQDNTTWGMGRVELASSVAPGASVTFSFNVTAPAAPANYNFQWRMVEDAVEWFGDFTPNVAVKDGVNDSTFVSHNVPATMTPGQTSSVTVTMQNTGTTTWTAANLHRLGAQNPQDNTTWGASRVELPNSVAPGASATFTFNVTAPSTVGSYNFQWKMVKDNVEWFGASTPNVVVNLQGQAAPQVYYIHPDNLGTPRLITRSSDDQVVWRWDNTEPFGNSQPNENPSALGTFIYNLRFPGQYYDAETGTHYNYFRDYDPSIGRYVASDPVGLSSGTNTYAYVFLNPIGLADRSGRGTTSTYSPGAPNGIWVPRINPPYNNPGNQARPDPGMDPGQMVGEGQRNATNEGWARGGELFPQGQGPDQPQPGEPSDNGFLPGTRMCTELTCKRDPLSCSTENPTGGPIFSMGPIATSSSSLPLNCTCSDHGYHWNRDPHN